jgi:hypothetical protein
VICTQLAHDGAAERVPDDHGPSEVQLVEHSGEVVGEAPRPDRVATHCGSAVAPKIDRDHSEAVGEIEELVVPRTVVERQTVYEEQGNASAALHDVQLRSVVGCDLRRPRSGERIVEPGRRSSGALLVSASNRVRCEANCHQATNSKTSRDPQPPMCSERAPSLLRVR